MRKWIWLVSLLLLIISPLCYAAEKAVLLDISGAIGPATQDYVKRGIEKAVQEKAGVVILQLNTPGGLESSMRGINEAIMTSPIPVITYVYPAGAHAASAGTFIMYASHLTAMAPGTNVGAASPINLLSSGDKSKTSETAEHKAMNDAAAYMNSLAQLRGRNADWGDQAVRQAASISAEEAKKLKVIDEIAIDYPDLLKKMDGHKVLVLGTEDTVATKNLQIEKVDPDWRYKFLSFITNPNIAYLLMLVAIYGLFFELSNPGLILPGVVGVIALILMLYAFQLMPINYAGLALIATGIGFMMLEIYMPSYGALGVGGAIAFIVGSIMLFDTHDPNYRLTLSLVFAMSAITIAFFFVALTIAIRSHKRAIVSGKEALIGSEGVVLEVMNEQVIVRVQGEIWEAKSHVALKRGEKIKVTAVQNLKLTVEPSKVLSGE